MLRSSPTAVTHHQAKSFSYFVLSELIWAISMLSQNEVSLIIIFDFPDGSWAQPSISLHVWHATCQILTYLQWDDWVFGKFIG